ncbi:hypothetical protein ALO40_04782 [Pseudomonas syringae pv. viburni]|uniref:Isochorismatase family protein n=1 Tax=Pseudomonas syringae pv. viburni TaxID=251703 RepID=A0A0Q0FPR4_9PSED|nr:hypothetical protein ALO40_04782 [Pseudomonas syringae pv. viburni]
MNKDDAVVLLIDHQTGLISLVQDFSPNEFKNNVLALADLARFFKLPTILTTSLNKAPTARWFLNSRPCFPMRRTLRVRVRSMPGITKTL